MRRPPSACRAPGRGRLSPRLRSVVLAGCPWPWPWPVQCKLVWPLEEGSWTARETPTMGWTVFETPSTPGSLPYFRSSTSGPDPVLTSVSGRVVPVMLVRERSAAGERPAAVEDPRNVAGALAIRSGRKGLLAWGDDAPAAGLASTRRSAWRRLRRRCRRVSP